MAVVDSDLKLYASLNMLNEDVSLNGGAIDTSHEISTSLDEVFKDAYTRLVEQGDRVVYRKVFWKNTHATDSITETKIWIKHDERGYVTMDLETAKNGNDTSPNRVTAPTGYTFREHRSEGRAHYVPGGATLGPGTAIGVWLKLTVPECHTPKARIRLALEIKGWP